MLLDVFIPMEIKSQNQFQYAHWKKYAGYNKQWRNAIGYICRQGDNVKELRYVTIVSVRKRLLDMGNLIGGAKPIPDALTEFNWIVDDSPKWVKIKYEQRKPKEGQETGTRIKVER